MRKNSRRRIWRGRGGQPLLAAAIICGAVAVGSQAMGRELSPPPQQQSCGDQSPAVQILGSGGPMAFNQRASSGYLVWLEGRARVMVDAGGGTFLRFGQAGARLKDLDLIAISHFHADHVAGLAALLHSGAIFYNGPLVAGRGRPLKISGPWGTDKYPDTHAFMAALFGEEIGAFRVLSGLLGGKARFQISVQSMAHVPGTSQPVMKNDDIEVRALGVPHADVPSLAYRVDFAGHSVVFGSDQNGGEPAFKDFVKGVDVLVMHFSLSKNAANYKILQPWFATPSVVGKIAGDAGVGTLVLTHLMDHGEGYPNQKYYSLYELPESLAVVRKYYSGRVIVARDLECIVLK